jgi:hypothetical protein
MSEDIEASTNRLRGCEWLEGRNCGSPSGPHSARALMSPARLVDGGAIIGKLKGTPVQG